MIIAARSITAVGSITAAGSTIAVGSIIATGSTTAATMRRSAGSRGSTHRHNLAPDPTGSYGLPTSTVHRDPGFPVRADASRRSDSIEYLAYLRGHRCGPCRACWSPKVRNVSYLLNAALRSSSREAMRVHLAVLP